MVKFNIIKYSNNNICFVNEATDEVPLYCQEHRALLGSKCLHHYKTLFQSSDTTNKLNIALCPYGLNTTTPFGSSSTPRIISGFFINTNDKTPPNNIPSDALIAPDASESIFSLVEQVSLDIRLEEMEHFEAALHDARHLNHSITQHAERILANHGYPPGAEWDMSSIQQDENARRALSIYAASRDLSDAISMHEISQDISRAKTKKIATQIHRLFYRQLKISAERINNAGLKYVLGGTQRSIMLTPEFKLIPKILIDNAIKYSSRGSEISISFLETSHFYKIVCTNLGPIIRPDEYDSIFTRGGRGSNMSGIQGRGIGLWLAKVIVDANMGSIGITTVEKSREYNGRKLGATTITIRLSY